MPDRPNERPPGPAPSPLTVCELVPPLIECKLLDRDLTFQTRFATANQMRAVVGFIGRTWDDFMGDGTAAVYLVCIGALCSRLPSGEWDATLSFNRVWIRAGLRNWMGLYPYVGNPLKPPPTTPPA